MQFNPTKEEIERTYELLNSKRLSKQRMTWEERMRIRRMFKKISDEEAEELMRQLEEEERKELEAQTQNSKKQDKTQRTKPS